jgi:hypothetical protein
MPTRSNAIGAPAKTQLGQSQRHRDEPLELDAEAVELVGEQLVAAGNRDGAVKGDVELLRRLAGVDRVRKGSVRGADGDQVVMGASFGGKARRRRLQRHSHLEGAQVTGKIGGLEEVDAGCRGGAQQNGA